MPIDKIRSYFARRSPAPAANPRTGEAAVSIVFAPQEGELSLLLIQRARHPKDPWSGQIGLPGGRRDAQDADLLSTAMRETREETGMRLQGGDLIGELDEYNPQSPRLPRVIIRPYVFSLSKIPELRTNQEVDDAFWVPVSTLASAKGDASVMIDKNKRRVPAYSLGDRVVWGITYRIITPLVDLCR